MRVIRVKGGYEMNRESLSYWISMTGTVAFAVTAVLAVATKGVLRKGMIWSDALGLAALGWGVATSPGHRSTFSSD